jgi:hypothetical protein
MDEDVKSFVKRWRAPSASAGMDGRMKAAFRVRFPWWRRWWSVRVEVPAPALAAFLVLLVVFGLWAIETRKHARPGWEPVAEPTLRVIRTGGIQ